MGGARVSFGWGLKYVLVGKVSGVDLLHLLPPSSPLPTPALTGGESNGE